MATPTDNITHWDYERGAVHNLPTPAEIRKRLEAEPGSTMRSESLEDCVNPIHHHYSPTSGVYEASGKTATLDDAPWGLLCKVIDVPWKGTTVISLDTPLTLVFGAPMKTSLQDQDVTVMSTKRSDAADGTKSEVETFATFRVKEATAHIHTTSGTFYGRCSELGPVRGIAENLSGPPAEETETVYKITGHYLDSKGVPDVPATLTFLYPSHSRFSLKDGRMLFAGVGLAYKDGRVGRDTLFLRDGSGVISALASQAAEEIQDAVAIGQD